MCKSKIHGAPVTDANFKYTGSITIDKKLLEEANVLPWERVQVVNINNGSRIETYVMEGKTGQGTICMNGAAARLAQVGDKVIILSYSLIDEKDLKGYKAKIVFVDDKNQISPMS
jgi:aspartate 1-decarboxylase